jgi:hypothetical protein
MKKVQKIYFIILIIVIVSGLLLSLIYRPYIYSNNYFDFGFADTIGSLVSVIGLCFFYWSFKSYSNNEKNKHIIISVLVYSLIWEPMGLIGIHGTFDWKDIVATIISGILTFLLKEIIDKNWVKEYENLKSNNSFN